MRARNVRGQTFDWCYEMVLPLRIFLHCHKMSKRWSVRLSSRQLDNCILQSTSWEIIPKLELLTSIWKWPFLALMQLLPSKRSAVHQRWRHSPHIHIICWSKKPFGLSLCESMCWSKYTTSSGLSSSGRFLLVSSVSSRDKASPAGFWFPRCVLSQDQF